MDCSSIESWSKIIGNIGFPMFMAVFLLLRIEPALHALATALTALTSRIEFLDRPR